MWNMCIYKGENKKAKKDSESSNMSGEIQGVLNKAKADQRLICGLSATVSRLEQNPDDVILCLLPSVRPGDSATHMQIVLLQAFCYENYIPVIQVDNSKSLAQMCGMKNSVKTGSEFFCAIVVRDEDELQHKEDEDPPLSPSEKALVDFYERSLNFYPQPVIHLSPPVS
ncbi:growth arrest and DNA damage-inducible protein GADD45 alpha [Agrilus planipennis]|uniref:Growth arrest and DNA damage-inducible protein GADD45 alpha n=1 Tax=Agrilus planipennis TaxID=224129 RepID=A0A1W4X938_AGRPL|nr:growth arrest and DNA damage-inducible protein GADD45 alpha [Agrilus planipennis]